MVGLMLNPPARTVKRDGHEWWKISNIKPSNVDTVFAILFDRDRKFVCHALAIDSDTLANRKGISFYDSTIDQNFGHCRLDAKLFNDIYSAMSLKDCKYMKGYTE